MKMWEDLTKVEQLRCIYSDLYKEITGSRPNYDEVDCMTEQQLEYEINRNVKELRDE